MDTRARGGLEKVQRLERDILLDFATFCNIHSLKYFVIGGTLLGAVRHGGFIPWDDDIDVGMPREDYELFLKIGYNYFNGKTNGYLLKNKIFDNSYVYYFSRIIDKNFTFVDKSATVEKTQNPWIDIFPIDGMPSGIKQFFHRIRLNLSRLFFQYSRFDEIVNVKRKDRTIIERILIFIGKILPVKKIFDRDKCFYRLDKALKKYLYNDSHYAVNFMGAGKFREMHEKRIYDLTTDFYFEGLKVKGLLFYDKWLKKAYGDYNVFPEISERNKHYTYIE